MKIKISTVFTALCMLMTATLSTVSAQEFSFESDDLTQQGVLGEENLFEAILTNLSNSENRIHLELDDRDFPDLWGYFWCVGDFCLPPETREFEIDLAANATDTVFIHIFPDSVEITGSLMITAHSLDAPDVRYSLTFTVEFDGSVENPDLFFRQAEEFIVCNAYPNPFNSSITINYTLNSSGNIDVALFNTIGQPVRTLYKGRQTAGTHHLGWDGLGIEGTDLPNGIYFINIMSGNKTETIRIIKLR